MVELPGAFEDRAEYYALVVRQELRFDVDGSDLNTPSALLRSNGAITRTVTNVGTGPMYYSSTASGFVRHEVSVTPAAIALTPGESTTFTVTVAGNAGPQPLDDGWVTWRGANGNRVRIPVVIVR